MMSPLRLEFSSIYVIDHKSKNKSKKIIDIIVWLVEDLLMMLT